MEVVAAAAAPAAVAEVRVAAVVAAAVEVGAVVAKKMRRPAASYSLPPTPREFSGLPLRHREPPPRILDHRGLQIALSALPPHHLE